MASRRLICSCHLKGDADVLLGFTRATWPVKSSSRNCDGRPEADCCQGTRTVRRRFAAPLQPSDTADTSLAFLAKHPELCPESPDAQAFCVQRCCMYCLFTCTHRSEIRFAQEALVAAAYSVTCLKKGGVEQALHALVLESEVPGIAGIACLTSEIF